MLLMYYLVFPLNYRKSIINEEVGEGLKEIFMLEKQLEADLKNSNNGQYFQKKIILLNMPAVKFNGLKNDYLSWCPKCFFLLCKYMKRRGKIENVILYIL